MDETSVYWTDPMARAVMKLPIGGGAMTTLANQVDAQGATGIALDSTTVYWANDSYALGAVMKVSKAGGTPAPVASAVVSADAVAVSDAGAFWTNLGGAEVQQGSK